MPLLRYTSCSGFCLLGITLLLLCALPGVASGAADSNDPDELCTPRAEQTGNHATLILPADAIETNGSFSFQPGDRLAAFTEDGLCVGETVWTGENAAITLWGNDGMTQTVDGLRAEERFTLALWSQELAEVIRASEAEIALTLVTDRPHFRAEPTYAPDAIYLVQRLKVAPST